MATIIAIFDVTTKEKESFEHYFTGSKYKLLLFTGPASEVPVYEYKDAEIISVYTTSNIDAEFFTHSPKLKLITCRSTGFDNIDLVEAKKRNVTVCNVPAYGQTTVAEYAIMLMLMSVRKIPAVLKSVAEGQVDYKRLTGFTLQGKTLGVIGTGKIGQSVIAITKAMGMHIIAFDPFANNEAANKLGFSYVKLPELLAGADIVTLHAPLTPENKHMINKEALEKMKDHAILINTARGELVDTEALIEALRSKQIAGAALDVIEGERAIDIESEHDLLRTNGKVMYQVAAVDMLSKMNNVILTPHNAFNSREGLHILRKTTAENIHAFLDGKPQNVVELK